MTEEIEETKVSIEVSNEGHRPCTVCFETYDGEYARLMIKLRHEEMKKKEFFLAIINGFLNDDPDLRVFLKRHRKAKGYGARKESILDKEIKAANLDIHTYHLDDSEIDDLYDIMDEEAGL